MRSSAERVAKVVRERALADAHMTLDFLAQDAREQISVDNADAALDRAIFNLMLGSYR